MSQHSDTISQLVSDGKAYTIEVDGYGMFVLAHAMPNQVPVVQKMFSMVDSKKE